MNAKVSLGLATVMFGAGVIAGCGGGGGASATHLTPNAVATASSGSVAATQGTTTQLTMTIDRSRKPRGNHTAGLHRSVSARRSPSYESAGASGIQITVTSGSATTTLYFDLTNGAVNSNCTTNVTTGIEACTLTVPVLGPTETFTAIEVDTAPDNETPSTGQGTAFPSNSHVLAIGTQTIALTAGVVNTIPFSLNPVIDSLYDEGDGSVVNDYHIAVDPYANETASRIVVTPNTAGSTFANPAALDASGSEIFPPLCTTAGTASCIGQSFVDVNASPVPVTVTSNSSAFTVYPVPIAQIPDDPGDNPNAPLPLPSPFSQNATIPDSSYLYFIQGYGGSMLDVSYSGQSFAPGTTITLTNGLSATPPIFTGPPASGVTAQPGPYTASMTYTVVAITATPATLTFASPSSPAQTVTGSDVGAEYGMEPSDVPPDAFTQVALITTCTSSGGTAIAYIAVGGLSNGSQPFPITPIAIGTCTFVIFDYGTLVWSNPITVTVN